MISQKFDRLAHTESLKARFLSSPLLRRLLDRATWKKLLIAYLTRLPPCCM